MELLWTREDPGTYANDLTVGEDGGIYVVASEWFSPGEGNRIYRYDSDGTLVWQIEDPSLPTNAVAPAPGGGVYVGGGEPVVFLRLDGAGKIMWMAEAPMLPNVQAMATTPEGDLVATGMDTSWWAHARDSEGAAVDDEPRAGTSWRAQSSDHGRCGRDRSCRVDGTERSGRARVSGDTDGQRGAGIDAGAGDAGGGRSLYRREQRWFWWGHVERERSREHLDRERERRRDDHDDLRSRQRDRCRRWQADGV